MLKESEIQVQRLVDNLAANSVGELELDQLLDESPRVIERGTEQKKSQFDDQVDKNASDLFRLCTSLDGGDYSINDELSYPGLRRRQERAHQGEKAEANGGPAVGLPHELDSLGSMGERAMEFFPPLQQGGHRKTPPKRNRLGRKLARLIG